MSGISLRRVTTRWSSPARACPLALVNAIVPGRAPGVDRLGACSCALGAAGAVVSSALRTQTLIAGAALAPIERLGVRTDHFPATRRSGARFIDVRHVHQPLAGCGALFSRRGQR